MTTELIQVKDIAPWDLGHLLEAIAKIDIPTRDRFRLTSLWAAGQRYENAKAKRAVKACKRRINAGQIASECRTLVAAYTEAHKPRAAR